MAPRTDRVCRAMHVIVRRKPKENNFKGIARSPRPPRPPASRGNSCVLASAVLETIRDLANSRAAVGRTTCRLAGVADAGLYRDFDVPAR